MNSTNHRPAGLWSRVARRCLIAGATVVLSAGAARAAGQKVSQQDATPQGGTVKGEWPQWRGPNRDEKSPETGLLKEWPKEGPKQVWRATGLGSGYAGVAVVGDRIYTMGDDRESGYVRALDGSGKVLWSTRVGKAGGVGYPGSRCTPTVDGDRVYALGQLGDLVCLNAADGTEVWRKDLQSDFGGERGGWGYAESPLIDGNRLVCTPGSKKGTLLALNKTTGETLWQTAAWKDKAAYASPIVVEIGGRRQYIQLTEQTLAGVAADDGKVLWQTPRRGSTAVIPTPIYHDGIVFVTSGYNVPCHAFRISSDGGTFKVEQLYTNNEMINHHGGVILHDGYLYGHSYYDRKKIDKSDAWVCMELKTGNVAWRQEAGDPGKGAPRKGTIMYADGHFYLRDEGKGAIALIEASPKGYKEISRFNQPDRAKENAWPHMVIANGKLYVRDQDNLFCYDVKGS